MERNVIQHGVVAIPLGRSPLVAIVDVGDLPLISELEVRWCAISAGKATGGFYAKRKEHGRTVYMHRLIAGAKPGEVVDHANGDGLDNRRVNLRVGTLSHNCVNRRYANASGFRGVQRAGRAWTACIGWDGKSFRLGTFKSAEDAAEAYDRAARDMHGEFAITNFQAKA